jgi:hypothetical protein
MAEAPAKEGRMITVGIITAGIVVLILGVVLIVAKATLKERVLDQIKRILDADTDDRSKIWLIRFLLENEEPPKQVAGDELCKAEKLIIGKDARLSMADPASEQNK